MASTALRARWLANKISSNIANIYLVIALCTTIVLTFLIQPLHAVDEPAHFLRIMQISNGSVMPVLGPDRKSTGSYQDAGTASFAQYYGGRFVTYMDYYRKTSVDEIRRLYLLTAGGERRYVEHSNTTMYFPLAYVAPVVAIAVAKLFSAHPLVWLYVGRLVSGASGTLLTYGALRVARRGRMLFFVVGMLPVVLFQTAALSADSLLVPSTLLLATILGRIIEGDDLPTGSVLLVTLAAAIIGLGKIAYLPVAVTPALVAFLIRRRIDRTVVQLGLGAVVIVVIWAAWSLSIHDKIFTMRQSDPGGEISVPKQLALVAHDPFVFLRALANTLKPDTLKHYIQSFAGGIIGWLDTLLSGKIVALNVAALCAALLIDPVPRTTPILPRLTIYAACAASAISVFLLLYLQWTAVGAGQIDGVQGRYFLPLLPILCVAIPAFRLSSGGASVLATALVGWAVFSAAETLKFVWLRYWGL